ncbi:MAG: hypothetical protein R3F49_23380 [Planctomycetota bacterium]
MSSPLQDLPAPRASRREGYRPLALTLALAGGLVAAWQALAAPHVPEPFYHPSRFDGSVFWVGPGIGPFYAHGDVARAELIVVGDSRAFDDIELETLAAAGLGRVARIWGPNADLADLLTALRELRPKRVLIVASPSLFGADYSPLMTQLLQEPPPALDRLSLQNGVARWRERERARLLAAGPAEGDPARAGHEASVDALLGVWSKRLTDTVRRDGWSTKEVDRVLNEWVDRQRALALATFTTQGWHKQWTEPVNPTKLAAPTRAMLRTRTSEQRAATRARFVAAARALLGDGAQLAAVRAPIDPSVLAVEREFVTDEDLRALFTELALPYFEDQSLGLRVRDGSHLLWRESIQYTRRVADQLHSIGW